MSHISHNKRLRITAFATVALTLTIAPLRAQVGAEDPSVDSATAANAPLHTALEPLELTLIVT